MIDGSSGTRVCPCRGGKRIGLSPIRFMLDVPIRHWAELLVLDFLMITSLVVLSFLTDKNGEA
ncbi:MAG: hypothetical protein ACOX4T_09985 [Acetivibrionales bacterium]